MSIELTVPAAGESISEVQIGTWYKAEGDRVDLDEAIVEIETDKASMDLPAPVAGVITRISKQTGDMATVGEVIATIDESATNGQPAERSSRTAGSGAASKSAADAPQPSATPAGAAAAPQVKAGELAPQQSPHVMPAAARLLEQHGIDASQVEPTGPRQRLLKEDVQRHIDRLQQAPASTALSSSPPPAAASPAVDREEVVPMTQLRRRIAARLVEAQQAAALLTTFNEVDMSAVKELRSHYGPQFLEKHGIKLGFMSFFVKATIEALKQVPQLNAEIRDDAIVYKHYYDMGVAVSTDKGLIVPVLRDADRLSFAETEQTIADLAVRARKRTIGVEELQGGTFTISNGGVYGSLLSTPIVNPPQSGILGLHSIEERPVARDGAVVIRPMMYIALTYDHRIIDGREGVLFLRQIKALIEDPARMLLEI